MTLKLIAEMVNNIHDGIINIYRILGIPYTDKALHFWIMGGIGLGIFFLTDALFKWVAKLSISVISFIYTFTVLVVLVFTLEIVQKITGRGNMEFLDIIAGLWGFMAVFSGYLVVRMIIYGIKKLLYKK